MDNKNGQAPNKPTVHNNFMNDLSQQPRKEKSDQSYLLVIIDFANYIKIIESLKRTNENDDKPPIVSESVKKDAIMDIGK